MTREAPEGPGRALRIALMTPYTGGNLGDAAIQEAAIQAVRRRQPHADLIGITLAPDRTSAAHGIRCAALSGVQRIRSQRASPDRDRSGPDVRSKLRGIGLFRAARPVYRLLRSLARVSGLVACDVRHTLDAWRVARSLDLLVVAGGGQLDECWGGPWGQPYALAKWAVLTRAAGKRLVILSVGTHALESGLSRRFVRGMLARAAYRSFRDDVSKRLAQGLGAAESDPVVPDLAFGFDPPPPAAARQEGQGTIIGVSPIAYMSPRIWPRHDEGLYRRHISALTGFVVRAAEAGSRIRLFISDECDEEALGELERGLEARLGNAAARTRISRVPTPTLGDLLGAIRAADVVVASRLHGILLSHLLLVPVVALSYDRKVDTYMADNAMGSYRLDLTDFEAEELFERVTRLMEERDRVRESLRRAVAGHRTRIDLQYDSMFGPPESQPDFPAPPMPR